MHLENCEDCQTIPPPGAHRFLVKNAETRESRHVIAATSEEAIVKTGWKKTLFTMLVRMGEPPNADQVRAAAAARLSAIRAEKEASKEDLKNERDALRVTNRPSRSAEGQQKGQEEEIMKRKSKAAKRADAFLPAKFTRKHGGEDHIFERDGDAWRLDGKGPMALREAMAKLLGEEPAKHRSFVKFFAAGKIVVPGAVKAKTKKASAKKAVKPTPKKKTAAKKAEKQIEAQAEAATKAA